MNQCIEAIQRIIGIDHVRPAVVEDAVDAVQPQWVVAPASAGELAQVLTVANGAASRVIPRGGATKLDWGNPPRGAEIILSTKRMDRVIEHAAGDMTATVQAGCTVAEFNKTLAERGQRLALDPLWPDAATIGGIVATNDNGAFRLAYGTLRDHLIGITVALADGTLARSGGKVVKNVAGYDLPKLFTGSFGTLGVITEATFRLYPNAHATRLLRFAVPTGDVLSRVLAAFTECSLVTSAVQIEAADDQSAEVSVWVEGLAEAIDAKVDRVNQAAIGHGAAFIRPRRNVGPALPADTLDGSQCPSHIGTLGSASRTESDERVQKFQFRSTARERLFTAESCVAKFSLLPTQLTVFMDHVRDVAAGADTRWQLVAQSVGVGLISFSSLETPKVIDSLIDIRRHLDSQGGSLTLLRCPLEIKRQIDAWPDVGSALPLMREIKRQFDPNGILSPGRFVGGI